MNHRIIYIMLSCVLAFCSGCGGGSGALSIADGGIGGTGISFGSISAFGSVVVNGKRFEIGNQTQINIEGQAAAQTDLKIGFVVRVQSEINSSVANRIEFAEDVRGRVDSVVINNIDALDATISVLGQTVRTDELTRFANVDLSTLSVNDIITVSGTRNAQGSILASYLEKRGSTSDFRIMGPISKLSINHFDISGLSVDFSSANIDAATLEEGQIVRVRGTNGSFTSSPPTLLAGTVDPGITLAASPEDEVELKGVVTRFASVSNFDIGGQTVDASGAAFENGSPEDIRLNTRLEVEGGIDTNGILRAEKIDIEQDSNIRIEAVVEAVNTANSSLTLLGVQVSANALTVLEDDSDAELSSFGLADINVGDYVEVRGFLDGVEIVALSVEREDTNPDSDEKVILQAPVEQFNEAATSLTLLGITVTAATASGTDFEDQNDNVIAQAAFYGDVKLGSVVKVSWEPFVSTANPADEISLEAD